VSDTGKNMIKTLHDRVEDFFNKASDAAPQQFNCKPGCAACCIVDLSVFEVEARLVEALFAGLDRETRQRAAQRAQENSHCCMLEPETGLCIVYQARPLICRSHGLTILIDGKLDCCPLNYTTAAAPMAHVLDLEKLNTVLVSINAADGGSGTRTRLADIAVKNTD
jgi:Fe-S-cluster containining protein